MVRRYCRENKVPGAVQTEQGWMIPEGVPKPGVQMVRETPATALVKKIRYQRERNNHFGIYEYIQVNMAYSNSRMASNRLTRKQVEEIYRTNHISPSFEATKVDDIVEIKNHFICIRYVVDNITLPLTVSLIKQVHYLLCHGTYVDQYHKGGVGEFRMQFSKIGESPQKINKQMADLLKNYERKDARLDQILDFHVQFERIRPFDDYNGRLGRIIMLKECLRYGVDPFIIDDKHRGEYNRGLTQWETNPDILKKVVGETQKRFQAKLEVCQLLQYNRY
jgi:Fic family protein